MVRNYVATGKENAIKYLIKLITNLQEALKNCLFV